MLVITKQTDALKAAENPTEKRMHKVMESCPTKMAFSFVGGFGMGAIFGLFTASVDPQYNINPHRIPTMKELAVDMGKRAYSTGKNFALLGVMFSFFECNIESYRGKELLNIFIA